MTHTYSKHFNWKYASEYSLSVNKRSAKILSLNMGPLVRVQCYLSHLEFTLTRHLWFPGFYFFEVK